MADRLKRICGWAKGPRGVDYPSKVGPKSGPEEGSKGDESWLRGGLKWGI